MIGPETRGAIPIRFARATASSVLGCSSLKFHAAKLKMNARTARAIPIIAPNNGFVFFGTRYPRPLTPRSGFFIAGLAFMSLMLGAKEQKPGRNTENHDKTDRHHRTNHPNSRQLEDASNQGNEDG